jgi:hypothetical protein
MKLTFIDKFGDWLLNQRIVELASERNEAISKIKSMSDTLNKHLFKLYVFQNSLDRGHWKDEILGYLEFVIDQSWGKKHARFENTDYFDWLFYLYFHLDSHKRSIKNKMKQLFNQYEKETTLVGWTEEEFYNKCERFYTNICPFIEQGVIPEDIIESLLNEFDIIK